MLLGLMVGRIIPIFQTSIVEVRGLDRVSAVIAGVGAGQIKGWQFGEAIEDFTLDELERLSDRLIEYYSRKFQ
jgi:hypothetical protein